MSNDKINVLIVDDDHDIRESGQRRLERRLNAKFSTLDDGCNAIIAIREIPYDLVLLDLSLPGCDGFHVVSEVRKFNSEIKIIIISGHLEIYFTEEQKKLLNNEIQGIFLKGEKDFLQNLLKKIEELFGKSVFLEGEQVEHNELKGRPEAQEIIHILNGLLGEMIIDSQEYFYALEHGFFKDKSSEEHIMRLQKSLKDIIESMKLAKDQVKRIAKI